MLLKTIFFSFGPVVFGLAGFALSLYISIKKAKAQPLVCPMNGECDVVTTSKYSKFFGVPVERIGVVYYLLVILVYTIHALMPWFVSDSIMFLMTGITIGAFFFSAYLVFIQGFILKKWCTWCLFSAGFSTFIFITAVFGANIAIAGFLAKYRGSLIVLHTLSAAIGVGAATITDVMFFKFLKDYRISQSEQSLMNTLSNVIWFALGMIVITGIGIFIPESERLLTSSKFLIKVLAVCVVIVNGSILNLVVSPKMVKMDFGSSDGSKSLRSLRKLSYALGAISITSWYTIFILGSLKSIPFSFTKAVLFYVILLVVAVIGGQLMDRRMVKSKEEKDKLVSTSPKITDNVSRHFD